jgi:hypothetical protein
METPQDISDYKMTWKPNAFSVPVHSDLDWQCKDWCRKNLQRWEWSMNAHTAIYEHTFLFEKEEHAKRFVEIWKRLH